MSNMRKSRFIFAMLAMAMFIISFGWVSGGAIASAMTGDDPPPFSPADMPDARRFPRAAVIEAVEAGQSTADDIIITPRIVGGAEVDPENAYPWTASLQYDNDHYCGGSLIGGDGIEAQWVLTAAHCWTNSLGTVFIITPLDTVVFGEHSLTTPSGNEVVRAPLEVYIHPNFNYNTLQYDFALIKLDTPVTISDVVAPINIAHVNGLENSPATVAGWGTISADGPTSDVLLEAQVEIFPDDVCANYGASFDPDSMLCAGTRDYSADTCYGDSGGPLFIQEETGSFLLPGITSWGNECALEGFPGVYADVTAGLDWIYSYIYPPTVCAEQTSIPLAECEALTDLYYETKGNTWTDNTNWLTGPEPCTWFGVTCTAGNVTGLDLGFNHLNGFLPFTLENLSSLTELILLGNEIIGPIPNSIGNLTNLEILMLESTGLTGSIPAELGNLTQLTQLGLSPTGLSGTVPYQLGNLYNLEYLSLSNENLTGPIPFEFTGMMKMQAFTYETSGLCEPQYPAFTDWLDTIPTLGRNNLPCTPTVDSSAVPAAELNALIDLYNSTNGDSWTDNTGWLMDNSPCDWYGVTCRGGHVTRLDLDSNNLDGQLPASLIDLLDLNWLGMGFNHLTGTIPAQIGQLSELIHISFEANAMIGSIPVELGSLSKLRRLNLQANALDGELPADLGSLAALRYLYLSSNSFFGSLPARLTNLTNLEALSYAHTVLCAPDDAAFQDWISGIAWVEGSGISCGYCAAQSAVPETECQSLVAFYGSTGGENWVDHTGWLADENLCAWSGVTCSGGHVTGLSLGSNQLFGRIPYPFGELTSLQTLDLGDNSLYGETADIWKLFNLQTADLSGNQFTGNVAGYVNDLIDLEYLNLSNNQFSGEIISQLGALPSLQVLLLNQNAFSGPLPTSLGNLPNLMELNIGQNNLSGSIPLEYTNLFLTSFGFAETNLCEPQNPSFQTWLDDIAYLERTNVPCSVCPTQTDIPLAECEALEDLYVSTNGDEWLENTNWLISEDICSWYGLTCTDGHITTIYSRYNNLTGTIPASLQDLTELQHLDLGQNYIGGSIPTELGSLSNLVDLYLHDNQLEGGIPVELGDLSNLVFLYLFDNQLDGSVPASLGQLSKLQVLSIEKNNLSGELPSELGNLIHLVVLAVDHNPLTGSIPVSFVNMGMLLEFYFSNTSLCEPDVQAFQDWLSNLSLVDSTGVICPLCVLQTDVPQTECEALEAFYTSTDGDNWNINTGWSVDENVCSWYAIGCDAGHVTSIDFNIGLDRDNNLAGVLPPEIGDLTYLQTLSMPDNYITAPLPAELFGLPNLELLDLETNLLSGEIPAAIGGFAAITDLYLRENAFSGPIPAELYQLSTLEHLELAENSLDGALSADIQNLINLSWLDLSANAFSGNIPSELGNIPNLLKVYLSNNAFTGTIPESLGYLGSLQRLNLSGNKLEGEIPLSFQGPRFDLLDLSNNQLSGSIPNLRTGDSSYVATYIYLRNNQLTGSIPTSFSTASYVDLSYNLLSGDIPLFYSRSVDFSHNNLDGSFYETPGYAGLTSYADYSYNQIGGEIPDLFLSKGTLNLSHNNFTGSIPNAILNQTSLMDLNVSVNQLSGDLPAGLASLSGLTHLRVNDNNFVHEIPAAYVNLPLQTFYFNDTGICAPDTPEMQAWLGSIADLQTTGTICDFSGPVVSFLAPLDGGVVLQPRSWIIASAEDPESGVKQVEFYAKLNGTWTLLAVDTTENDGWRYLWATAAIEQETVDLKLVAVNMQEFQTVITLEGLTVANHYTTAGGYQSRGGREAGEEAAESQQPASASQQPESQQPASQVEAPYEAQENASPPRVVIVRKFSPIEHPMTIVRFTFWRITALRMPY